MLSRRYLAVALAAALHSPFPLFGAPMILRSRAEIGPKNYAPRRSRYDGAALREIRAHGQHRECARRRARMTKAA